MMTYLYILYNIIYYRNLVADIMERSGYHMLGGKMSTLYLIQLRFLQEVHCVVSSILHLPLRDPRN